MNKRTWLISIMLGGAMIVGCSGKSYTEEANKELVRQSAAAMNNQEYDRLGEFFAPDFHRYCQATPDVTVESLDDFVRMVRGWYEAFPDAEMGIDMIIAEGDLVALWGKFTGTHQAPMGDIPATGKRIESDTFAFFRIVNGKITESWVTWDNVAILTQLGLYPPPADSTETSET